MSCALGRWVQGVKKVKYPNIVDGTPLYSWWRIGIFFNALVPVSREFELYDGSNSSPTHSSGVALIGVPLAVSSMIVTFPLLVSAFPHSLITWLLRNNWCVSPGFHGDVQHKKRLFFACVPEIVLSSSTCIFLVEIRLSINVVVSVNYGHIKLQNTEKRRVLIYCYSHNSCFNRRLGKQIIHVLMLNFKPRNSNAS